MKVQKNTFLKGIIDGLPICLGYLSVSFAFGIFSVESGLSILEALLISMTNVTSAGQLAAVPIIVGGGTFLELAATQLIINLRYCLMSSALSQKISHKMPFFHRFIMSFGVTDEIFGLSVNVQGKISPFYSYGIMSVAIPGWTFGTLLGIISGSLLSERILSALSVALYGMFIAVIIPAVRKSKIIAGIVVVSMLLSLTFTKIPVLSNISSGFRIIILTVVIAGIAAFLFPIKENSDKGENAI